MVILAHNGALRSVENYNLTWKDVKLMRNRLFKVVLSSMAVKISKYLKQLKLLAGTRHNTSLTIAKSRSITTKKEKIK